MKELRKAKRWPALAAVVLALATCMLCTSCSQPAAESEGQASAGQEATGQEQNGGAQPGDSEKSAGEVPESAMVSCEDAYDLMQSQQCCVVDVRVLRSFGQMHIEGAINVPSRVVETRIREIPVDGPVLVYSQNSEDLSGVWSDLVEGGIPEENIKIIQGGMNSWVAKSLPTIADGRIGC